MRLQMPEHVATRARSSHGCEREEGENACTFRGGRIARIYFVKKKSSTVNSLIYSSYTIYRPEFLEPFELYMRFCRSRGNKFSQPRMMQYNYKCIYNMNIGTTSRF